MKTKLLKRNSIFLLLFAMVAVIALAVLSFEENPPTSGRFLTAKVERGSITKSVSASGQLNPVVMVEVGSEISGQVSELLVDFNSKVKSGQVIARIDPERFEAEVLKSKAELSVAKAVIAIKQAAVDQANANLANAKSVLAAQKAEVESFGFSRADLKLDYDRKNKLQKKGVIADSQVDKAKAAWEVSVAQEKSAKAQVLAQQSAITARKAQLAMAEAEVKHAQASAQQKEAALHISKVEFKNTYIRSPVDGVVIGKDIDMGQTVAASFQAPKLFTIANGLRKMQVETNIDEADIGQIMLGQFASFTVDSFPGRTFSGTVNQVRKKPQEVQNVVTYTVVIDADNYDLRLFPGMTANVEIKVSDRKNVLKIPTGALRFTPFGFQAPEAAARSGGGPRGGGNRRAQAQARFERLAKGLNLNEQQKDQVRNQYRKMGQRIRAMRQSGSRNSNVQDSIKQMQQKNREKIMELLNPDQKNKFQAMIAERLTNTTTPGRVWVLEDGKPKLLNIMLGVGDGKFFELSRGELEEGWEVIVGEKRDRTGSVSR